MEFLYLLEQLRTPWLDEVMLAVTQLGDETAFLVLALIVFWCGSKWQGYYLMSVGFAGTVASQFLKLACRVPRPWVQDPDFTILEAAREGAGGYSFPSGHSQASVGTFGSIARTTKKLWIRILCILVMIAVPFSRMYIGVHTPADVLAGSAISLALIFLLHPIIYRGDGKGLQWVIFSMVLLACLYLLYVEYCPFPADMDAVNLASGQKNAYTLLGSTLGVAVVFYADRKWLNFSTNAVWWAQIAKVVLGLLLVLAVKEGLRTPLEAVLPILLARVVRYFLVVVTAGLLWPISFQFFSRIGRK